MEKSDNLHNALAGASPMLRRLVLLFLVVLSVGYTTGFVFVQQTSGSSSAGIIENYNGNDDDEDAEVMKFKKSSNAMLNIIHTHIISMSILFFVLALLVYATPMHAGLQRFLMLEPLVSVLLTFGGIYLVWMDIEWMAYLVMLSGTLMTLSFIVSVAAVSYYLIFKN